MRRDYLQFKLVFIAVILYVLPLVFDTVDGHYEFVWLVYLLPTIMAAYEFGVRGGLYAAVLGISLHFSWEFREHLGYDTVYNHHNFLALIVVDAVVLLIGITFGLVVNKARAEKTLRNQTETDLQHTSEELATIMDSMSDGLFFLDRNLRLVYVNKSAHRVFPKMMDNFLGKSLYDSYMMMKYQPEFITACENSLNSNQPIVLETSASAFGKSVEIRIYPSSKGLIVIFRDISEIKQLHQEMLRLDRLNLVGVIASGLGHEIRNPLTTVRGYLQLMGEKENSALIRERYALMISELDQANDIITEFLSLSNTQACKKEVQNLNGIIHKLEPLISTNALGKDRTVVFELGETPDQMLNSKEIQQLLINLTNNGLEAMDNPGVLTIKTYAQDNSVVLEIRDQGTGINTEDLPKLGTPFWTTKDYGTGLGLAVCYGIAQRHDATIDFNTSAWGTTVCVKFQLSRRIACA